MSVNKERNRNAKDRHLGELANKHTERSSPELRSELGANHGEEEKLNGTFASVMVLGAVIVVSWLGVFFLFLDRA